MRGIKDGIQDGLIYTKSERNNVDHRKEQSKGDLLVEEAYFPGLGNRGGTM